MRATWLACLAVLLVAGTAAAADLSDEAPGIHRFRIVRRAGPATGPLSAEAARQDGPSFSERRTALYRKVREITSTHLDDSDSEAWEEGRRQLLTIRDPAGVDPVARLLGRGDPRKQELACEVLGGIPGDEAKKALTRILLVTPSDDVYLGAVEALKSRGDRTGHLQLVRALGGRDKARQRAAYALGELGDQAAVPALVEHLTVRRQKIYQAPRTGGRALNGAYIAVGTVVPYVADAEPVVSEQGVAFNPQIRGVMTGAVLAISNVRVVGERKIVTFIGPAPAVREALRKITGEDFGYDRTAWRRYINEH